MTELDLLYMDRSSAIARYVDALDKAMEAWEVGDIEADNHFTARSEFAMEECTRLQNRINELLSAERGER